MKKFDGFFEGEEQTEFKPVFEVISPNLPVEPVGDDAPTPLLQDSLKGYVAHIDPGVGEIRTPPAFFSPGNNFNMEPPVEKGDVIVAPPGFYMPYRVGLDAAPPSVVSDSWERAGYANQYVNMEKIQDDQYQSIGPNGIVGTLSDIYYLDKNISVHTEEDGAKGNVQRRQRIYTITRLSKEGVFEVLDSSWIYTLQDMSGRCAYFTADSSPILRGREDYQQQENKGIVSCTGIERAALDQLVLLWDKQIDCGANPEIETELTAKCTQSCFGDHFEIPIDLYSGDVDMKIHMEPSVFINSKGFRSRKWQIISQGEVIKDETLFQELDQNGNCASYHFLGGKNIVGVARRIFPSAYLGKSPHKVEEMVAQALLEIYDIGGNKETTFRESISGRAMSMDTSVSADSRTGSWIQTERHHIVPKDLRGDKRAYIDKLQQDQWQIAERQIMPIRIVKPGSDISPDNEATGVQVPATQADINAFQERLKNLDEDPLLSVITTHVFDHPHPTID